ncbi:MAG: 5-oxoprolinase subunit PxpA [Planctomycetota bacterium]
MIERAHRQAIDLNADNGERAADQHSGDDAIIQHVTSVNIACGGHTGDDASMRLAVRAAARAGVAIGAHPSYPDRAGFGRVRMKLGPEALRKAITDQIGALDAVAQTEGVFLSHCKPHGALYHAASEDESVARAIYEAATGFGQSLRLVGQAGSPAIARWRAWGALVAEEAFADRVYEADGSLRARTLCDALITDPHRAAEQAVRIALTRTNPVADSTVVVRADTLCVHSDTPNAVAIAARVASSLLASGVTLRSPNES